LGWNCTIYEDEIAAKWTYEDNNGQCNVPLQETVDGVIIEGSQAYIAKIKSSLNLLRSNAPEWYAYSIYAVIKIREAWGALGNGTLERTFNLQTGFVLESSVAYMAAIIVHESCHIQRWRAGISPLQFEDLAEEAVCDIVAIEALNAINPGTGYGRSRIDEFLGLGIPYDLNGSVQREVNRARHIHSTMS
jgi:hypothetical protein